MGFVALAVRPRVEGNGAIILGKILEDSGFQPLLEAAGVTMQQDHRFSGSWFDVVDPGPIGPKELTARRVLGASRRAGQAGQAGQDRQESNDSK